MNGEGDASDLIDGFLGIPLAPAEAAVADSPAGSSNTGAEGEGIGSRNDREQDKGEKQAGGRETAGLGAGGLENGELETGGLEALEAEGVGSGRLESGRLESGRLESGRLESEGSEAEAAEPSVAQRRVSVAGAQEGESGFEGAGAQHQTAEEAFDFRIQGMGEQVNELKEQVARTKARLQILADTILGGSGIRSGARLNIEHHNRLGMAYRLVGIQAFLDGAPVFLEVDDTGSLQSKRNLPLFEQRLVPGEHQLVVHYTLKGSGRGLLSYLDHYTIELTASHDFSVEAGTVTSVKVGLRERRGLTLRFEERPDVVFETHVETELYRHRPDGETAAAQSQEAGEGARQ